MVKPLERKSSAQWLVTEKQVSIERACMLAVISRSSYYYQSRLQPVNELIAEWLIKITQWQHNWGFGLCFLYLRNIKGFSWNHKRVYRIYCELSLNLRIKPKKRLVREKPQHCLFQVPLMSVGQWILCTINLNAVVLIAYLM